MGVTINFQPTTEEDKQLVQAVSKLAGSPADVFTTYTAPTGQVKDKFILHSKGIIDLQKYVLMGMQFPSDNAKFETKMPQSSFSIISKIDESLWARTRDQFVEISVSCKKFHDNYLYTIVNSASTTRNYASRALRHLSQAKYVNLRENLLILLDPKYRKSKDEDYDDAESKAEIFNVLKSIRAFRGETAELKKKVGTLTASYDMKRTMKDGSQKNISEAVDAEHARVLKDLEGAERDEKSENKTKSDVDGAARILITISFPPTILAGSIMLAVSKFKLEDDVANARNRVQNLDTEKAAAAKLITYVAALKSQFKTIDDTMQKAITAMEDLTALFDNQEASFEEMIKATGSIRTDMDEVVYKARRGGIIDGVDIAINNIAKLQTSADEFMKFYSGEKVEYEKFKIWE
ncbi:hypothetical protein ABW21_db0205083 [Orbilia brochopaga]|nr:hypothetical protein ABW21_db0205083 [Drechslerella brochopaga]